uniref:Chloroplast delta-12 fatty acid desaturase n=1 Tax=Chlamydomonas sp. ICE-L TaxID=309537 RepID=G1ESZ6_9CHLO|nr:chloroplast delta-12 fatty acid desaturase [Chlamydomonas sp. ICE-L]
MAISMQKMGGSLLQVQRKAVSSPAGLRPSLNGKSSMLRTMTKANAFTIPASMNDLTDAERHQLAKDLGYTKIGKELPSTVTLNEVVRSMPAEVFEIDHTKAWLSALTSIVSMSASLYLISIAPWYLLPIAWFIAGTAFTGWFVVGHDAGHRSFHKNNLVEDIVGTFFFAPLLFPFEPWRIKHNHHHAHTNKLIEDTAWHPITEDVTKDWNATAAGLFRFFLGTPLKCFASIGHWAIWHFNLGLYKENQKPRVIVSWLACAAFAFTALPALVYYTGWVGLVKFWLMPWLGYHFWMSTFTMIHHTAPHIPFKEAKDWNAAQAQLAGTVHCNFPGWIEFLCHDINVHVPHHVSSKIPWYNLRKATDSLRENWGEYMTECDFNWRIMKNIWLELHLYDEDQNYKSFDFKKPEPFFTLQRKIYPNAV